MKQLHYVSLIVFSLLSQAGYASLNTLDVNAQLYSFVKRLENFPRLHNGLYSIACDSLKQHCTAIGSYIENGYGAWVSPDGGLTWTRAQTIPTAPNESLTRMTHLSCDNTGQRCVVVGSRLDNKDFIPMSWTSIDGGKNWATSQTLPLAIDSPNQALTGVFCSKEGQHCVAVGYRGYPVAPIVPLTYFSKDGGKKWVLSKTQPPPVKVIDTDANTYVNYLYDVACDDTVLHCTAVGLYLTGTAFLPLTYTSSDSGHSWQLSKTLPQSERKQGGLYSISCNATGRICIAAGLWDEYYLSQDGGNTWSISNFQSLGIIPSLTCDNNAQRCVAIGFDAHKSFIHFSVDGGRNWVNANVPDLSSNKLNSVACDANIENCIAVGGYDDDRSNHYLSLTSSDGGKNWVIATTPT